MADKTNQLEAARQQIAELTAKVKQIQAGLDLQDKAVEGRTQDYLQEWEKNKPVEGALRPDDALFGPAWIPYKEITREPFTEVRGRNRGQERLQKFTRC